MCVHVRVRASYLGDEGLGSGGAHEEHGTAQGVAVAVELLRPHGPEQAGDHHVDVGLHLLQGHVQPLLGRAVQEVLDTPDIWGGHTVRHKVCDALDIHQIPRRD